MKTDFYSLNNSVTPDSSSETEHPTRKLLPERDSVRKFTYDVTFRFRKPIIPVTLISVAQKLFS